MESAEEAHDGSWSSFSTAALVEESEFMAQLLGPCQFSNEQGQQDQSYGLAPIQWSSDHAADSYHYYSGNSNVCYWSQGDEDTNDSLRFAATPGYESYYNLKESSTLLAADSGATSMNHCVVADQSARQTLLVIPSPPIGDPTSMNEEASSDDIGDSNINASEAMQPKRKPQMLEDNLPSESCKKKARTSTNVAKSSNKAPDKRTQKRSTNGEDKENDGAANGGQSSCSYSSEDDSNASQDQNGGGCTSSKGSASLSISGKTRAGRGSATDPQSIYARKRRERINERLKILQNLIPNGTKVDISTMLEEAVQYVKFLQLQIKLLSSDELWMYAPIAYNGMNIGLDLKISPPK